MLKEKPGKIAWFFLYYDNYPLKIYFMNLTQTGWPTFTSFCSRVSLPEFLSRL